MKSALGLEIRQGKPFANLEEEVFLNVLRTGDALLQGETEVLRAAELTFPQYNVLRILRGAGTNGASCGEIAERMVNRDPDLTRLLDRLESRGLVERSRDARDRRVVMATITDAGKEALKSLDVPVARVHRERLRHMTRQQLETLAELLALARSSPTD
ncbi:MAG: Transcriptional regulator, MarR family [Geminicoccaceae bacterium]|jgi:DNA-binding MarR family transcriptional regulator|nr:Transcriptional regulator, MarR family [Geminicoccaceae bacterium]